MNIEIDITDPKKLARARASLLRWLKIVDFALLEYSGRHQAPTNGQTEPQSDEVQSNLVLTHVNGTAYRETDAQITALLQTMKRKFTTTDLILGLGDRGKESRYRVKMALKRAEGEGEIRLVKPGKGRRPSEYEKIAS